MWKTVANCLSPSLSVTAFSDPLDNQFDWKLLSESDFGESQDHHTNNSQNLLIVSPYTNRPHLLDLDTLSTSQKLVAKALTQLAPTTEEYATTPYLDAFNWHTIHQYLKSLIESERYQWENQFFYIVVFKSQVPPTTDRSKLGELDRKSHAEAMKSGGLLKYWFGIPNAEGRNLATCTNNTEL